MSDDTASVTKADVIEGKRVMETDPRGWHLCPMTLASLTVAYRQQWDLWRQTLNQFVFFLITYFVNTYSYNRILNTFVANFFMVT